MSQVKVDRYKEKKATRKKDMKKEKRWNILRPVIILAVIAVAVAWFLAAVIISNSPEPEVKTIPLNVESIDDYMNTLD